MNPKNVKNHPVSKQGRQGRNGPGRGNSRDPNPRRPRNQQHTVTTPPAFAYPFPTAMGDMVIAGGSGDAISQLTLKSHYKGPLTADGKPSGEVKRIITEVQSYLKGSRHRVTDVPWKLAETGTPFQRKVWRALRSIPPGKTRTYGEIAAKIGSPGAARAVGSACGANPVLLLVPCHRVVGSGGGLGGFSLGLPLKKKLLRLETTTVRV